MLASQKDHPQLDQLGGGDRLSDYMERKLARVCTRPGCSREPHGDLLECAECLEDSRSRKRKSAKKTSALRRAKGQCVRCGKRSRTYRCRGCRGLDKGSRGLDKTKPDRFAVKVEQDSTYGTRIRTRYIGQGKRGRSSREEEAIRDLRQAIKTYERAIEDAEALRNPAIQGPERTDLIHSLLSKLRLAEGFGDEVRDRYE